MPQRVLWRQCLFAYSYLVVAPKLSPFCVGLLCQGNTFLPTLFKCVRVGILSCSPAREISIVQVRCSYLKYLYTWCTVGRLPLLCAYRQQYP